MASVVLTPAEYARLVKAAGDKKPKAEKKADKPADKPKADKKK